MQPPTLLSSQHYLESNSKIAQCCGKETHLSEVTKGFEKIVYEHALNFIKFNLVEKFLEW